MELWRGFIEQQCGETLDGLQDMLSDQTQFAKFARQIIEDLGYGDQLGEDPDQIDDDQEDDVEEEGEDDPDPDSTGQDDSEEQSEPDAEQSQEQTDDMAEAQVSMDEMADEDMADETEMPDGEAPLEPPRPRPFPRPTRITRSSPRITTRKSAPKTWPNRSSWSACAPIWISSSNR